MNGMAFAAVGHGCRKPLSDEKYVERRQHKEDDGIPRQAIGESFSARGFEIFLDGHGPNVTSAAPIKITGGGMVEGMFPAPLIERREGKQAAKKAPDIVRSR